MEALDEKKTIGAEDTHEDYVKIYEKIYIACFGDMLLVDIKARHI